MKKMFNSNLFHENRLVFRAEGPKAAPAGPESVDKPKDTGKALEGMNMHQAEAMAKDKIARTAEAINTQLKRKPSENLKQLHKKLVDLSDKFEKKYENYNGNEEKVRAVVASTIEETNKLIDTKMPEVKAQIIGSSLGALTENGFSTHGRDQKWADSMVSAFSMMNSGETVSKNGVSFNRNGDTLTVKAGTDVNVFKLQASNEGGTIKWDIYAQRGREKHNMQFADNPIDFSGDKYKRVESKTAMHLKENMPKEEPKAEPKKAEKPKEVVKEDETAKVAELLKLVHEHSGAPREIRNDLFKAFQNFIKDIAKDSTKAFNNEGLQAYVTRSKDGKAYRISTEMNGSQVVQYLSGKSIGSLPKKAEFQSDPIASKIKDLESGKISGRLENKPAPNTRPKIVDTNAPTPNPKLRKILKDQEEKVHEEARIAEGMKEWTKNLKKAVDQIVKSFESYSKIKDLAKEIQQAKGCDWNQAGRDAVRFKDWCQNFDRSINLTTKTPQEAITAINQGLKMLPGEVQTKYAQKFGLEEGKSRLASLGKGVPSSSEVAREEVAPKPQKESSEVKRTKEGYDHMAKQFGLEKININEWTGTNAKIADLKDTFRVKEGKSPVMKDGKGNEFYFVVKGDAMELHIRNKGEKYFKYAFKEVNGEMVMPEMDVRKAPESGKEKYDKQAEANFQTLLSKFKSLKKGDGVGFKMKDGTELIVHKVDKNTCEATDEAGNSSRLDLKDLAQLRNIAQLVENNPTFKKPIETKSFAKSLIIAEGELSVSILRDIINSKNIKDVINSPDGKASLRKEFQYLSKIHAEKEIAHTYEISDKYSISVSEKGVVRLNQKGVATITYTPKKKSDSAEA